MDEQPQVAERLYSSWQRASYRPPPCPVCGTELIPQWLDADGAGPHRLFRLTYTFCCNSCEDR